MKKKLKYENYIKKEYGMDYMEEETKESKLSKAKTWSLIAKICGAVIIIIAFILKWLKVFDASISEILACGFSVMGVFGTVDANIIIDKFMGK